MNKIFMTMLALTMTAGIMTAQDTKPLLEHGDLSTLPGEWVLLECYTEAQDGSHIPVNEKGLIKRCFPNGYQHLYNENNKDISSLRTYELADANTLQEDEAKSPFSISGDTMHIAWVGRNNQVFHENWLKTSEIVMVETGNSDVVCMVVLPRGMSKDDIKYIAQPYYSENDPLGVDYAVRHYRRSSSSGRAWDALVMVNTRGKGEFSACKYVGEGSISSVKSYLGNIESKEWIPAMVGGQPCESYLIYRITEYEKGGKVGIGHHKKRFMPKDDIYGVWESEINGYRIFISKSGYDGYVRDITGFNVRGSLRLLSDTEALIGQQRHRFEIAGKDCIVIDGEPYHRYDKEGDDSIVLDNYTLMSLNTNIIRLRTDIVETQVTNDMYEKVENKIKKAFIQCVTEKDGTLSNIKILRVPKGFEASLKEGLKDIDLDPIYNKNGERVRVSMIRDVYMLYKRKYVLNEE